VRGIWTKKSSLGVETSGVLRLIGEHVAGSSRLSLVSTPSFAHASGSIRAVFRRGNARLA
jgi:hypothetical protein